MMIVAFLLGSMFGGLLGISLLAILQVGADGK